MSVGEGEKCSDRLWNGQECWTGKCLWEENKAMRPWAPLEHIEGIYARDHLTIWSIHDLRTPIWPPGDQTNSPHEWKIFFFLAKRVARLLIISSINSTIQYSLQNRDNDIFFVSFVFVTLSRCLSTHMVATSYLCYFLGSQVNVSYLLQATAGKNVFSNHPFIALNMEGCRLLSCVPHDSGLF